MAKRLFLTLTLALLAHLAVAEKKPAIGEQTIVKPKELSLVRVNVTGQAYEYFRPWQKKAPFSKRALGAVLSRGRVLVTADLVANQNFVELERAESGEKCAANVLVIDYEANLALIEPAEKKFLEGLAPLELALDTTVGDRLSAWQLETTGALVVTDGLVTTVGMTRYPADIGKFLTYRMSIPMQYRDNSFTVPLVKNNKLAALLLRFEPRSQVLDAIPAPVIAHFLKDAEGDHYRGFPNLGGAFFPTRDPQLRKFAGETGKPAGVYVSYVEPSMSAGKAGLQAGDIVTAVGDHEIDQNGNYVDPLYGKIDFFNLITTHSYIGDTLAFRVQRAGKPLTLSLKMEHRAAKDYVIPPYDQGEAPSYFVLGGIIFQELSRTFLKEWGGNWQKDAPQRLVYFDQYQFELFPESRERVVIMSQVLSTNSTIGYDEFNYLTVKKLNGKPINSLGDLAAAAKEPIGGFHKLETEEDPKQLELDAAQVSAEAPALQDNYGLPSLERLKE